jgi:MtrB/PioB family decaheme-associated outer membrane protein
MGSVTRATGGDIGTLLPDPIDQRTDQFSAQVSYHNSHRDFLQASYTASVFKNNVAGLTWQNWALPTAFATLSSPPDNKSSQFNLAGGHDFGARTRLTGSASYSRNTQDAAFLVDAGTPLVPVANLDGVVKTTNYGLKLTTRPVNALTLNLGYRYDNRDNQTKIHTYGYYDANDPISTTPLDANFAAALGVLPASLGNNVNINASRPYSRKSTEYTLDADYRFTASEVLHAGYGRQQIDRWCNGAWFNCMDAAQTRENTFNVELRSAFGEKLHTRFGYTRADRKVDAYNENAFLALVPLADVAPVGATTSAYQYMVANGWNGYGPSLGYAVTTGDAQLFFPNNNALNNARYQNGNRISELLGMRRYNMADRKRDRLKGELDWQASERWALQANADWRRDDYSDLRYGVVGESDFAATLDAEFTAAEDLNIVAFYTHERQSQDANGNTYTANSAATNVGTFTAIANGCYATIALRNANNKIDPCLDWAARMDTMTDVYGFTVDRKGLLPSHKLDLKLQALVSDSTSANDVGGGNYANNPLAVAGAPAGTIAAYYIRATALPDVIARSWEVRLFARYQLNKVSSLRLGYLHAYYLSRDYAYDGLQLGGLAGVLPTLQVAPSYGIDVVTVGYAARF